MDVIEFPTLALNCPFNPPALAFGPTISMLLNSAGPFRAFFSLSNPQPKFKLSLPSSFIESYILSAVVSIVCCISCPVIQGNFSFNFTAVAVTLGAAKEEPCLLHPGSSQSPFAAIDQ